MPTDAEFLALRIEESAKGLDALSKRAESLRRRADERLKARIMTPIPRKELIEMLATMNFNNITARGKLVDVQQRCVVPWLPVGDRDGEIYRIIPGAYGLLPDQQNPKTERELASMNVLGVNTNVQLVIPSQSRKAHFSGESTKSNESDDMEQGGFVFHQIGDLEYWGDEPENLTSYEDAANGDWLSTELHCRQRFDLDGWGLLPGKGPDQRVAIAKIADKITDLRFGRTFKLTEVIDYPVELVRAVVTPESAIIQVTVA
ncbi:MAG: hypothetical protein M1839_000462 [Geoglossum umbratile]|nr:MAG: hypothetical protein M1839_000462 [Geoglossum umbratile]